MMTSENEFQDCLYDTITLLKIQAKEAKQNAQNSKLKNKEFESGCLRAYHDIISLLKCQAIAHNIDEKLLGLEDIHPDEDLLFKSEKDQ